MIFYLSLCSWQSHWDPRFRTARDLPWWNMGWTSYHFAFCLFKSDCGQDFSHPAFWNTSWAPPIREYETSNQIHDANSVCLWQKGSRVIEFWVVHYSFCMPSLISEVRELWGLRKIWIRPSLFLDPASSPCS